MQSQTTNSRPRRRLRRALLAAGVAALAAAALPAAASAATVGILNDGTLRYIAPDGETNSLSLRQFADSIHVTDTRGVRPTRFFGSFAQQCVSISSTTVRCPDSPVGLSRIEASLGDRNDTAGPINTHLPVEIKGEAGNDTYEAGNPSFLTNVRFLGGGDVDTASYAGSAGTVSGRGVRISNNGVGGDGRLGLDTDSIERDVENLTGSRFADEINGTGDAALRCCVQALTGGQGNDVLRAGAGTISTIFEMGPVADGADDIIGGSGRSTVRYEGRTRPVNVTLNFGGADDGEPGEGDEITGSHEQVVGGRAGDTLRAPAGSTPTHHILGVGGNDQIDGADGPDTLSGDAGGDSIRAFGGDDRIFARDGELDTVSCGEGIDTFEVDSFDNFAQAPALCDNGTVGVLRLAPKTLRVKAGETARLKLAWSHPRSWRQLRRVTLRLYRGKARVGAVAISPRGRRVDDRGQVSVLRRSTRISRKGKTVSAMLALRLDESLAGQALKADVEATDRRGQRQRERNAGTIRVAG